MGWDLVIFDCDGVLVDSESIGNAVLARFLTEAGYPVEPEVALTRFRGRALAGILGEVERVTGQRLPNDYTARFRAAQIQAFAEYLRPVPGVRELVGSLPYPSCVASNGPHSKMKTTLGIAGLSSLFDGRVFSSDDVPRPKPHPDLFIYAAKALSARPDHTLVVEDSPLGIEASRRAGMHALGFVGCSGSGEEALRAAGAREVCATVAELRAAIERHRPLPMPRA